MAYAFLKAMGLEGQIGTITVDMTAALTEKVRTPLADAIHPAFVPVRHTIVIAAEP